MTDLYRGTNSSSESLQGTGWAVARTWTQPPGPEPLLFPPHAAETACQASLCERKQEHELELSFVGNTQPAFLAPPELARTGRARLRGEKRADCVEPGGATASAPTPQTRRAGTELVPATGAAGPRARRDSGRKRVITRAPEAPRSRRLLIGCGGSRRRRACSWPEGVGAVCCGPCWSPRQFYFPSRTLLASWACSRSSMTSSMPPRTGRSR